MIQLASFDRYGDNK